MEEIYRLISHTQAHSILGQVTRGVKENCFFIIDNYYNRSRRDNKQHSNFVDDCGVWESKAGKTTQTTLLVEGWTACVVNYRRVWASHE